MLRFAILFTLAFGMTHPAGATAPDWSLREYVQTTWTHRDGIPLAHPLQIHQTTDGYLWFISDRVLIRFDGVKFVAIQNLCNWVYGIESADNGSLWVLCREREPEFRLFRRHANGQVTEVALPDLPFGDATGSALFQDRRGRLWIYGPVTGRFEPDGSFRVLARVGGTGVRTMVEDAAGIFWLSAQPSIIRIQDDHLEYLRNDQFVGLTAGRAGGVFVCERDAIHRFAGMSKTRIASAPPDVSFVVVRGCLAEDASGTPWVATRQHGVARIRNGRIETLLTPDQPGSTTNQVFVDREDNVWVASSAGLHRFRKPHARLLTSLGARLPPQPLMVFADSRDDLWVGGIPDFVRMNLGSGVSEMIGALSIAAMAEDRDGRLWLSNAQEIGHLDGGVFRPVRDVAGQPVSAVRQFGLDAEGHVWAIAERIGLYQITPGPPRRVFDIPDASSDFLFSSRQGLWIANRSGITHRAASGESVSHDFRQGAGFYAPLAVAEIGTDIWLADTMGLRRWRNGQWTTWTAAHGLPAPGTVQEIITDRTGRMWITTYSGILALSRDELDATPDGAPAPLRFVQIGALDRVVQGANTLTTSPRVVEDGAGRLYFATRDSVAVVEPSSLTESSLRPTIVLESVMVDTARIDTATTQRFTAPSRLHFEYTSLSLRSPETIRFRYKLEGFDADWSEAGGAREATYGTLPPGGYRFRVIGTGSEGVWNEEGASYAFQIVPFFYNTWWFRGLILAIIAAAAVAAHRLRVKRLTREMDLRFEERLAERTRIAQDLHDTLLQGTLAASLHAQLAHEALDDVPSSATVDEVRVPLRRTVQLLSQIADEGRATVSGLRTAPAEGGLSDVLHQAAAAQPNHDQIDFRVAVDGVVRALEPHVVDDVGRIAREAVVNAYKHSQARMVEVTLIYTTDRFTCIVRDDGLGIQQPVIERGREGHWGLAGMRERAERAGGELHIRSSATAGTEVEFSLDGRQAYVAATRRQRSRWWRR